MARKERNNVDYFPHSVSHGKKMFYLRDKFKNDGYAVWFMLLEELGKADYHYLDLKDDVQLMYLSAQFKVSELMLNEIIETLVKFGEFDRELWEKEKILFNEKFIENISDAYKKRGNECVTIISLRVLLESKGRCKPPKSNPKPPKRSLKGGINPQRILKDSKEDEIKEEFNFKKSLLELGIEKQIVSDWLKVRSKKKAVNTETSFNSIKKQIEKANLSANECIKKAVEKNWAGFEAEWVNNSDTGFKEDRPLKAKQPKPFKGYN